MNRLLASLFVLLTFSAQSQHYVDGSGPCSGNLPCYNTIQAAVNAASPGETINVYPGIYDEMVTIEKPLILQSTGGKNVTSLQYTTIGNYLAPVVIRADAGSYNGVTIGGSPGNGSGNGTKFAVIGIKETQAWEGNSAVSLNYSFIQSISDLGSVGIPFLGMAMLGLLCTRRKLNRVFMLGGVIWLAILSTNCNARYDDIAAGAQKLYIRIAQVDKDGKKSYSRIVVATGE